MHILYFQSVVYFKERQNMKSLHLILTEINTYIHFVDTETTYLFALFWVIKFQVLSIEFDPVGNPLQNIFYNYKQF